MNIVLAALLNGMLVSAALVAAIWIALRVAPRSSLNAATRYAVWWAVMVVTAALPLSYLHVETPVVGGSMPIRSATSVAPTMSGNQFASKSGKAAELAREVRAFSSEAIHATALRTDHPIVPIVVMAGPWPARILGFWLLITALMLIRLAASATMLGSRKRRATELSTAFSARVADRMADCGGSGRSFRIASSSEISIPLVAGTRDPAILLPAHLMEQLSGSELEQIGIHEAAHIIRRDDYGLLVQRTIEALFALNPIVRWISLQIDLEREIACDDFVLAATGQPCAYAACLARVVELSGGIRVAHMAAAAVEGQSQLARRVDMLLDSSRNTETHLTGFRLAAAAICIAGLAWGSAKTPGVLAFARTPAVGPTLATRPDHFAPVRQTQTTLMAQATPPAVPTPSSVRIAPPIVEPPSPPIVFVPVNVTDPMGRHLIGLEAKDFELREDGAEQTIEELLATDVPLDVFVVTDPRVLATPPTLIGPDPYFPGFVEAGVAMIDPGQTPLEAISAIRITHSDLHRQGMLIVANSQADSRVDTEANLQSSVRNLSMPVYIIDIPSSASTPNSNEKALLKELASGTGGGYFGLEKAEDFPEALRKVQASLRSVYFVGYRPQNTARDGSYRTVEVSVPAPRGVPAKLTVLSRPGYNTPSQ